MPPLGFQEATDASKDEKTGLCRTKENMTQQFGKARATKTRANHFSPALRRNGRGNAHFSVSHPARGHTVTAEEALQPRRPPWLARPTRPNFPAATASPFLARRNLAQLLPKFRLPGIYLSASPPSQSGRASLLTCITHHDLNQSISIVRHPRPSNGTTITTATRTQQQQSATAPGSIVSQHSQVVNVDTHNKVSHNALRL